MISYSFSQAGIQKRAAEIADSIILRGNLTSHLDCITLYGVPRGGVAPAYAVAAALEARGITCVIKDNPDTAYVIIDDIIDSGATHQRYVDKYRPTGGFYAIYNKQVESNTNWVVFPWERTEDGRDESATDIVTRLLQHIGENADREGLRETPTRVTRAWSEWFSGYGKDPRTVLKTFEDGAPDSGLIIVKDIPFYSHCEHHMATFFGVVTIGYIANGRVVGLSKLKRLVDIYACRLQVQERLGVQIAEALEENLHAKGVGVLLKARHMCMESRGIRTAGTVTTTSSLRGVFRTDAAARAEFMELAAA